MKLLFDHNLSHRLVRRLEDLFQGSTQTKLLNLNRASDREIWDYASQNGLTIVSLDKDFADLALLRGAPPKVIWLRCGNSTVDRVESLLRLHREAILEFEGREESTLLEIWPPAE